MGGRPWSRTELIELAAGCGVLLMTRDLTALSVPDWLLGAGAGLSEHTVVERVGAVHPDDRRLLFESWDSALGHPGTVVDDHYRVMVDGTWLVERMRLLNLCDHPDVAGVLSLVELIGEAAVVGTRPSTREPGDRFRPTSWAVAILNERARIVSIDGLVEEMIGVPASSLVDRPVLDLIHPDDVEDAVTTWVKFLGDPSRAATATQRMHRLDGTTVWVETTLLRREDSPDGELQVVLMVQDITERRLNEQHRQRLANQFQMLAEQVPAAVFRCDVAGVLTFHNARWRELVPAGAEVPTLDELFHPDDRVVIGHVMGRDRAADTEPEDAVELELRSSDGERVLGLAMRRVGESEPGAGDTSFVGSVRDMTATVQLRRRAHHDRLTGLLNRESLEEHLSALTAHRGAAPVVLFLDLDGFKGVNDSHGHDVGDRVLAEIAERLSGALRPEDAVGRFGGDEFVIVCPVEDPEAGDPTADPGSLVEATIIGRLREVLAEPIGWPGGSWRPAASIGATRYRPGEDLQETIRRADHDMLAVKRTRRKRPA